MDKGALLWQAGAGSRRVTGPTFHSRFRRYLASVGLAPSGLHIPRHRATWLRRQAGESVEDVSAFLDHSSLAVTTTYLRRLEGQEDRTWRDVAEAIGV
jgi:integrase